MTPSQWIAVLGLLQMAVVLAVIAWVFRVWFGPRRRR